jgi:hypothetical protein
LVAAMREYTVTFPASLVFLCGFPQTRKVMANSQSDAEVKAEKQVLDEHEAWLIPIRRRMNPTEARFYDSRSRD